MDKVKVYLAVLKKYHFWLLAVVVVLVESYAWYKGKAAFDDESARNKGQITGTISSVEQLNAPNYPNARFKEEMDQLNEQQKKSTLAAWEILYKRQAEELKWPEQWKGIADVPAGAVIPTNLLDAVQNHFEAELRRLFEIVKPVRTEAAGPMPPAGEAKKVGIVEWAEESQKKIVDQYHWPGRPRSLQARLAQEDYWVYEALLRIIAATNDAAGATDNSTAAVKRIEAIAIAQAAMDEPHPKFEGVPAEALGAADSKIKIPDATSTDEALLSGRYLAGGAAPASGDDGGGEGAGATAGGSEFKLIPVRLQLVVDQRRIPDLLVACANWPLQVEVRQVRYNPGDSNRKTTSGQRGPAAAPMPGAAQGGQPGERDDSKFYDATIDVRGVIYLFNPPGQADEEAPAEDAAPETK